MSLFQEHNPPDQKVAADERVRKWTVRLLVGFLTIAGMAWALNMYVVSRPETRARMIKEERAREARRGAIDGAVQELINSGVVRRINCRSGTADVDLGFWINSQADQKRIIARGLAVACVVRGFDREITLYDSRMGRMIATATTSSVDLEPRR